MQEKDDKEKRKHPSEMTTDESIDYLFAPEIAEELRRQAGKLPDLEECPETDD